MKPWAIVVVIVCVAVVSAIGGFWFGFRQAWGMGVMADAAPRGAIAIAHIRWLDNGRTGDVKMQLESDIDSGLLWWHELSHSKLSGVLNTLSGSDVYPTNEEYVRRLAVYRKAHPSPFWDPKLQAETEATMAKADPAIAADFVEAGRTSRRAIEEEISKYAP
jgi:hypothetical protein